MNCPYLVTTDIFFLPRWQRSFRCPAGYFGIGLESVDASCCKNDLYDPIYL
jgi:hypothetical protein